MHLAPHQTMRRAHSREHLEVILCVRSTQCVPELGADFRNPREKPLRKDMGHFFYRQRHREGQALKVSILAKMAGRGRGTVLM